MDLAALANLRCDTPNQIKTRTTFSEYKEFARNNKKDITKEEILKDFENSWGENEYKKWKKDDTFIKKEFLKSEKFMRKVVQA